MRYGFAEAADSYESLIESGHEALNLLTTEHLEFSNIQPSSSKCILRIFFKVNGIKLHCGGTEIKFKTYGDVNKKQQMIIS